MLPDEMSEAMTKNVTVGITESIRFSGKRHVLILVLLPGVK